MMVSSSTPARRSARAPERRRSWKRKPGRPIAVVASSQIAVKRASRRPLRQQRAGSRLGVDRGRTAPASARLGGPCIGGRPSGGAASTGRVSRLPAQRLHSSYTVARKSVGRMPLCVGRGARPHPQRPRRARQKYRLVGSERQAQEPASLSRLVQITHDRRGSRCFTLSRPGNTDNTTDNASKTPREQGVAGDHLRIQQRSGNVVVGNA
jgi:hypothetical protein